MEDPSTIREAFIRPGRPPTQTGSGLDPEEYAVLKLLEKLTG